MKYVAIKKEEYLKIMVWIKFHISYKVKKSWKAYRQYNPIKGKILISACIYLYLHVLIHTV